MTLADQEAAKFLIKSSPLTSSLHLSSSSSLIPATTEMHAHLTLAKFN
jgi:hypothetical protein